MSCQSPAAYVPAAVVTYHGPTDTRGSRWVATIRRGTGAENRFRASVGFNDGPDAAAAAVVARFNEALGATWHISGHALSLDGGDTYAYPIGNWGDSRALDSIAALLSGAEWSADSIESVAEIVRSTGRIIADIH